MSGGGIRAVSRVFLERCTENNWERDGKLDPRPVRVRDKVHSQTEFQFSQELKLVISERTESGPDVFKNKTLTYRNSVLGSQNTYSSQTLQLT